ncbi:MAG: TolC family outer membrane protein [Spiribacter sp.]|nr:TolC family outer membrane protein [Spiribacter sp.]
MTQIRILMAALALSVVAGPAAAQSNTDEEPIGLFTAYQQALDQAPVIGERRALLEASDEVVNQAKARRWPTLSANARYTDSEYETSDVQFDPETGQRTEGLATTKEDSYNYGIDLAQPLYDRSVSKGVAEARSRRAVANVELAATRQDLASEVAQAYLRALRARATRELAEAEAEAYRTRWNQMERQLERNLASRVDVLDARVRYETALSDIAEAENELDAARLGLERLTGAYPQTLRSADPRSMAIEAPPTDSRVAVLMEEAGETNPQVDVQRERLGLAQDTVSVRQAERFPTITLEARYSDTNATDRVVQGEDARVQLMVQMPLFSGGGVSAGIAEARARKRAQRSALDNARREAMIETRQAVNELRSAYRRIEVSRQAAQTAEAQVEAVEQGLGVGLRDLVEVLDARAQLFSIRRDLAEAAYDYLIAEVQLQTITGAFEPSRLRDMDRAYLNEVVYLPGADGG